MRFLIYAGLGGFRGFVDRAGRERGVESQNIGVVRRKRAMVPNGSEVRFKVVWLRVCYS